MAIQWRSSADERSESIGRLYEQCARRAHCPSTRPAPARRAFRSHTGEMSCK